VDFPELVTHILNTLLTRNSLLHTLAGTGIGLGILPTNRQPPAVADATIALNRFQPTDIFGRLPAKLTFDNKLIVQERVNPLNVVVAEFTSPAMSIQTQKLADFQRRFLTNPM
jgi:hypothetical protein